MLSKAEIEKLIQKKGMVMADKRILLEAEGWEREGKRIVSPGIIATIYTYLKSEYDDQETLDDMQDRLGFDADVISNSIRILEHHGYVTVSRSTKPFRYAVIK